VSPPLQQELNVVNPTGASTHSLDDDSRILTRERLVQYFQEQQGIHPSELGDEAALFSSGLLDSFSMVDLIVFVEDAAGIKVRPAEVTLENFDSIGRILAYANAPRRGPE
jgi:acyl carrier protein